MALEPITRQEKIIAGQDLTPITRMEKFLKQYGGGGSGGGSTDAVLYTEQTLTDAQKKQARQNVDAASADYVVNGSIDSAGAVNSGQNVCANSSSDSGRQAAGRKAIRKWN